MSSDSHWRTANRLYSALAVFWERHRQFLFPRIIATFTLKASKSNREGSSGQSRLSILMIVEVSRNGPDKNTIALHLNSFDRLWITFGATHPWYTLERGSLLLPCFFPLFKLFSIWSFDCWIRSG